VDQGPAPRRSRTRLFEQSIRNVAYALLSGADGWMFDARTRSPDPSMSLDNQRNLKLAIHLTRHLFATS